MKKVVFTKHAEKKLHGDEALKLGITKKHILDVLKNPIVIDEDIEPKQSVGRFNEELSLSVIWKIEKGRIKVITFYASTKGRYESKILERR